MKALLAGNYVEANNYLKSLSPSSRKEYTYISCLRVTEGMIFSDYIIVGSFWERKDSVYLWYCVISQTR
jgi:hypothetical protein